MKKRTKKLLISACLGRNESGAALLLALWAMMAMAALVAGVRVLGLRDATLAAARLEQAQLAAAGDGMINLAVLRLLTAGPGGSPPIDGLAFPVSFGGYTGQMTVQDETGKIDLNQASGVLLTQLLISAGGDLEQAQSLAEKIQDWREPGAGRRLNGAKADDYRRAGYAYGPRGGKMESVDELRLVMGMTPALCDAMAPAITVVSQNAWPDQAVAPALVLRALPGMDDDRIAGIEAARAARLTATSDGTVSDRQAPPAVGRAFTIEARLAGRNVRVQRRATLRLTGILSAPVVVYQWQ